MEPDWSDAVSLRLVALALDGSGRLSDDVVLGVAARGALLVDVVLRRPDALGDGAANAEPTGFPPADRLLDAADRSPVTLLRRGRVDQADLAAEHVRRGSWTRRASKLRPRYGDQRAERTQRDAQAMESPPDRVWDPADAALAAIAGALGVLTTGRTRPTDAMLRATGPARPIAELVVQHVRDNIEAATAGPR